MLPDSKYTVLHSSTLLLQLSASLLPTAAGGTWHCRRSCEGACLSGRPAGTGPTHDSREGQRGASQRAHRCPLTGRTSGSSLHICRNRSGLAEECSGPWNQTHKLQVGRIPRADSRSQHSSSITKLLFSGLESTQFFSAGSSVPSPPAHGAWGSVYMAGPGPALPLPVVSKAES